MSSRASDVIVLLGAGASVAAGIPASQTMISEIETLLAANPDWKGYLELYNHVKSSIHYAEGLKGRFEKAVTYNIETLVNALYELERNEEHPLYPFIASWNSRFVSLAGSDFSRVRDFRRLILRQLKKWMCPEDPSKGDYYRGFAALQRELNYPLPVFSLNYDLSIERLSGMDFRVEAGFPGSGPSYTWDWERFEHSDIAPSPPPQVLLYKLHGSINWKRDTAKNLFCVEQIESVDPDQMEIIFGRDFKLEAADPYLFYAYSFRRATLSASLIICIGYGFGDAHINKMLVQALRHSEARKLFVVAYCPEKRDCEAKKQDVSQRLNVGTERLVVYKGEAQGFLNHSEIHKIVLGHMPVSKNAPF